MGLSNKLSCEAGSFSCHMNPHRFFQSEVLRLYFPHWNCALLGLSQLFLLVYPHTNLGLPSPLYTTLTTPVLQLLPCYDSSLPQLPISAPPTSLYEYFFFNSLVVGLPYHLMFWQFWLFFVLKLLLSFFWLWDEAQCVYVRLHLGRKPVLLFLTYKEPWGMCGQHLHTEWGPISPAGSSSFRLAASPLCPSCPSLPLLPVWMNVSSLSPWLSDFHTV